MDTTIRNTDRSALRILTGDALAQASGGAAYIRFDGIDGSVSSGSGGTTVPPVSIPFQVAIPAR